MLIMPMPRQDVPAYLRGFADWYVQSLSDVAPRSVDDLQARVGAYLQPQLDADGVPIGSTVFDLHAEEVSQNVGVVWAGGADLGFGPLFFVHDLRIHPPFRGRGFARTALDHIYEIAKAEKSLVGVALSVLASNTLARELYVSSGFEPVSEVLLKRF